VAERRWGISLPLTGVPLPALGAVLAEAEGLGYRDAWTEEVAETDGFLPLAVAAQATTLRLGTAIINVFTRGPGTLAMGAAAMSELAPGRFCLGVGAGSAPIVEGWNSGRYERPLTRVRESVEVLRAALRGERVSYEGETLTVSGFRLGRPPAEPPPIYLAALQPGMLQLAGAIGDGVIFTWLSAEDVRQSISVVRAAAEAAGRDPGDVETVARVVMVIDPPSEATAAYARRLITTYLNVPAYRAFHTWLGRAEALTPMWQAWDARDRDGALAAISESVVTDLVVMGSPEARRAHIERYFEAGLDTAVLWFLTTERDPAVAAERIGEDIRAIIPGSLRTSASILNRR